jgi:hypothetical protein
VLKEIRINSQPCKGINLTTRHTQARRAPQVATVHNAVKESDWVLPHPSVIFHTYALVDTPWVVRTLFHCTPVKRGKVSSNSSTHEATKFEDSIYLVCVSTFKCLFIRTQPTWALIDTGGGYHLGALNFRSDHSSSFPSSILSLSPNYPARSHIKPFHQLIIFSNHSSLELRYKKP